jgi:hypothetical protein
LHAKSRDPDSMASANPRLAYGRFLREHGERERAGQLLAQARAVAARHLPATAPALQPFREDSRDD